MLVACALHELLCFLKLLDKKYHLFISRHIKYNRNLDLIELDWCPCQLARDKHSTATWPEVSNSTVGSQGILRM